MGSIRIELNQQSKKIKLSPVGTITGFDGRVYIVDAETIAKTKAKAIDIPLNVEHCFTEIGCKAVGWFDLNSLEIRDDGVYATLILNKDGKELIKNKNYRYLSPEFITDENRHVDMIEAVALVNNPNLNLEINKKGEKTMDKELQIQNLQKQLNAKETQINEVKKQLNEKEKQVENLIDSTKEFYLNKAIEKNQILPAEKEGLKTMPLETLKTYLESRVALGMTKENNFKENNQKEDNNNQLLTELGWEV